jgi:4-amino-4-deoxy-L-arabinose transferase-like glycosyltransferase
MCAPPALPLTPIRGRFPAVKRLLLLLLALALFLPFLGRKDIVTSHEARVAQTAREMAASGWPWAAQDVDVRKADLQRDPSGVMQVVPRYDLPPIRVNPWVVPTMNGEIRLKKPPLPYWCAALLFKVFGTSEWAARLVPALMGALATLLIYDLARRLIGRRAGTLAAAVWLSSYFLFDEYRKAMADPYLAFFTLLAAWAWVSGGHEDGRWRIEDGRKPGARQSSSILHPLSSILVFYTALALGFLAKGPLILLPLGVFIAAYHYCYRRPAPKGWIAHLLGVALFALVTLPWPIAVFRAVPDAGRLWAYESAGGITDTIENVRPFYFYLGSIPQIPLPWTPVLAIALALPFWRKGHAAGVVGLPTMGVKSARHRFLRRLFPLVWLLAVVLLFSFSKQKKNAYLLPVAPAVVLAVTQGLLAIVARARIGRIKGWPIVVVRVQTGIALGAGVLLMALITGSKSQYEPWRWGWWAVLALVMSLAPLFWKRRTPQKLLAIAFAYGVAIFVYFNFWDSASENTRSPRPVAIAAAPLLTAPGANVFTPAMPPEAAFYLPLGMHYDLVAPEVYVLVDDRRKKSEAGISFFEPRLGRTVISAERVLEEVPKDERWKLFRVKVGGALGTPTMAPDAGEP